MSARAPERGWWTPEFRALLDGIDRGAPPLELQELDELACAAGRKLVGDRQDVNRLVSLALSIALAVDERRWKAARQLADELVATADDLRDTDAPGQVRP